MMHPEGKPENLQSPPRPALLLASLLEQLVQPRQNTVHSNRHLPLDAVGLGDLDANGGEDAKGSAVALRVAHLRPGWGQAAALSFKQNPKVKGGWLLCAAEEPGCTTHSSTGPL